MQTIFKKTCGKSNDDVFEQVSFSGKSKVLHNCQYFCQTLVRSCIPVGEFAGTLILPGDFIINFHHAFTYFFVPQYIMIFLERLDVFLDL